MHRTSLVSIVVHGRLLWAQPEALDKGAVEQAIKTIVDHDSDARDVHKTHASLTPPPHAGSNKGVTFADEVGNILTVIRRSKLL